MELAADIVMFDLEDAVAPDEKEQARATVIEAINGLDWGTRTLSVRINGLDTPWMYRDLIELAERAGDRLDLMMIPKVGTAADVYTVDVLLTQIEAAKRRTRRIGLELLIESALGMQNVEAIAASSPRIESLHLGPGDYAASTGARTLSIGGPHPGYAVLTDADDARAPGRCTGTTCGTMHAAGSSSRPAPMGCGRSTVPLPTSGMRRAWRQRQRARPSSASTANG